MNEWIKTSERLPEKDNHYLVTSGFYITSQEVARYKKEEGFTNIGFHADINNEVIFWCELPEPPKEGE